LQCITLYYEPFVASSNAVWRLSSSLPLPHSVPIPVPLPTTKNPFTEISYLEVRNRLRVEKLEKESRIQYKKQLGIEYQYIRFFLFFSFLILFILFFAYFTSRFDEEKKTEQIREKSYWDEQIHNKNNNLNGFFVSKPNHSGNTFESVFPEDPLEGNLIFIFMLFMLYIFLNLFLFIL